MSSGNAERAQSGAGERDLQRRVRRRLAASTALVTGAAASQARAASAFFTRSSRKHASRVMLVAEAHQALDVVELDGAIGVGAFTAASASRAPAASLIVAVSKPSRMRWLRSRSTA